MNKKLFLMMLAAAGMLSVTSCTHEELDAVQEPEFAQVAFTLGVENTAGTKAHISDGTKADKLVYAVYKLDENNNPVLQKVVDSNDDGQFVKTDFKSGDNVSVTLAKGQTYQVAFWAQDGDCKAYNTDDLTAVKVSYKAENGTDAVNNDELRDAFFKMVEFTVAGNKSIDVVLERPFAQINVGVTPEDWNAAVASGIEIKNSKVVVKNAANQINLLTGAVSGTEEVTYALNKIPGETLSVETDNTKEGKEAYKWLSMSYILVADGSTNGASPATLEGLQYTFQPASGNSIEFKDGLNSVPVQRNWRTNILGKILTGDIQFNITIDPVYDGETNLGIVSAIDLQAALDAAPAGETSVIYLNADIIGSVIDFQKNDRHVIIDGGGRKFDGTIKIHNGSAQSCSGSITIRNIDFETNQVFYDENEKPYFNFIMPNEFGIENGITRRYSQNVTVENCTFTTTNSEVEDYAVGVQAKSCTNLQLLNCTATGMHSLLQAQSCKGDVKVIDCTITKGKNGVAFKQVKNALVEGTTINANAYGIRFDGNIDNYGITVKGNIIEASQPFIVRKMTGKNNTIIVQDDNKLNVATSSISTESPAWQIVITNGSDDEEYSKPTGTYSLTCPDKYNVYPRDVYFPVANWNEFTTALAANEQKIILTANITNAKSYSIMKDVTINLDGNTLEISSPTERLNIGNKNDAKAYKPSVTIKNGNLNCKVYAQTGNVTLTDIKFGGSIAYAGDAQGVITVGNANLLASNCDMSNVTASAPDKRPRALSTEGLSSGYLKLIDCNFPSASDGTGTFVKTKMLRTYINPLSGNAQLEISNCKFGVAANIDLAASYVWNNMNLTGCSGGFTFTVARNINSLTDEETNIMKAIKKNNGGTIKAYYNGTLVTY